MSGKGDQVKGRIKEAAGNLTGNKDLESEGKADRLVGDVKEKVEHAKDKVDEVTGKLQHKVEEAIDKAKDKGQKK